MLNELPEEFRAPLILYYFEEFSYRQIAEQMGVPIGDGDEPAGPRQNSLAASAGGAAIRSDALKSAAATR